jgi:hypothetical protein
MAACHGLAKWPLAEALNAMFQAKIAPHVRPAGARLGSLHSSKRQPVIRV